MRGSAPVCREPDAADTTAAVCDNAVVESCFATLQSEFRLESRALRPGEDGFGDYIQVFHCATSKGTMSASGDWGLVSTTGH